MTPPEPALIRTNRKTGHEVLLIDMRDDRHHKLPEQPWQLVCEAHGFVCCHGTRKLAVGCMAAPEEWCEKCKFEVENGPPEPGYEVCTSCVAHYARVGYPAFGRCGLCRGMDEEQGDLLVPGEAGLDVGDLREYVNDGRLGAHLVRKLWRRAESIRTVEQHVEVVGIIVEELAWLVAGDVEIPKSVIDEVQRLFVDALEEEGSDD